MFYNLLGRMAWKLIKYYLRGRLPRGALVGAAVATGIVVLSLVAKLLGDDDEA